jgi:hypothetical protein
MIAFALGIESGPRDPNILFSRRLSLENPSSGID